jgi:hypothetical protein
MSAGTAPPRQHRKLVAVISGIATVLTLAAMMAVWANRQALSTDAWTETSGQLLENKDVQKAVSAYMVDQLFTNVDVAGELQKVLPPQLDPVAGPAAGGLQQVAGQLAPRLLASPKVQEAWRTANSSAHDELLRILDNKTAVVSTDNGEVVLNLRPLVDRLASSLGLSKQVAAARAQLQGSTGAKARGIAQQQLGVTIPAEAGRIVIMRSNQLKAAQDIANLIRDLAVVLTILALGLFALAIWLARGWRRIQLRRVGWCFVALGLAVLLVRRVAGGQIVDSLVASDSVKPAAHAAWEIGTTLLYDICIAMFAYGLVFVVAAWLGGPTRSAAGLRRALAPAFRYHLASVYGVVAVLYLLLLAWGPTAATRKPFGIILFAILAVLGVELLRRQTAREHPDVKPGETGEHLQAWWHGMRERRAGAKAPAAPAPAPAGRYAELEDLASLHDRGVLSDEEFDSQKVLLLNGAP